MFRIEVVYDRSLVEQPTLNTRFVQIEHCTGQDLREFRDAMSKYFGKKVSQTMVAEVIGVALQHVWNVEVGRRAVSKKMIDGYRETFRRLMNPSSGHPADPLDGADEGA